MTASETLLHIDSDQAKFFAAGYRQVEFYAPSALDEADMWAALAVLEHSPGPIGETLLADAATTLARLKSRTSLNGIVARQEFEAGRAIGIPTSYYIIFDREASRDELLEGVQTRVICKPLLVDNLPFTANP